MAGRIPMQCRVIGSASQDALPMVFFVFIWAGCVFFEAVAWVSAAGVRDVISVCPGHFAPDFAPGFAPGLADEDSTRFSGETQDFGIFQSGQFGIGGRSDIDV